MFFSIKQARTGGITEQLIGSLISAQDVEDGDIAFGDNEINYLKAVSYTHLISCMIRFHVHLSLVFAAIHHGASSVSYTHLDVYKRQHLYTAL